MKAANLGKLLGAFGLLLLLSSPVTLLTSGIGWLAGVKAGLGLALIAASFATNVGQIGQFANRRSTFFIASTVLTVLVTLVALIAVNYVAAKKNAKWDLTDKKIYTLAPQTRTTVRELKSPVRVIGFLAADDPNYDALDNLFRRYRDEAPEKFEFAFRDPRKHPDLAQKYQLQKDEASVVLVRGEPPNEVHNTLSVISEQDLTNALIRIDAVGEQKVYFVVGHGELPLQPPSAPGGGIEDRPNLGDLRVRLEQEGYAPQTLNLAGAKEIPRDAALLVIAGALTPLAETEVALVENYLSEGGRLLFFADPGAEAGLDEVLAKYAIQIDNGIVADDQFSVRSPYIVLSAFYVDHEITSLLTELELTSQWFLTRAITVLREGTLEGVVAKPIVTSSPRAWLETIPDDNPQRSPGEKTGSMPLGVASTRRLTGPEPRRFDEARVVAFGDADLLQRHSLAIEGNRNLVLNSVAWASSQTAKVTIRPPDRDISTLEMKPATLSRIRFVATDLLPMALLGMGLAIWLSRRNK